MIWFALGLGCSGASSVAPVQAGPEYCPAFGDPVRKGALAQPALKELSGLAYSRRHQVLWGHNDAGSGPALFAFGLDGSDRGTFQVNEAASVDWEDVTVVRREPVDLLVVGDIGDNDEDRKQVVLYGIDEPTPGVGSAVAAQQMVVRYPDGPHNAEALFTDPRDGALYILTKVKKGSALLYRVGPFAAGEATATLVGSREFPDGGDKKGARVTGADVSPDRAWLAVRTYGAVHVFPLDEESVATALGRSPCVFSPPGEEKGEAVTFIEGGLLTAPEGVGSALQAVGLTKR